MTSAERQRRRIVEVLADGGVWTAPSLARAIDCAPLTATQRLRELEASGEARCVRRWGGGRGCASEWVAAESLARGRIEGALEERAAIVADLRIGAAGATSCDPIARDAMRHALEVAATRYEAGEHRASRG